MIISFGDPATEDLFHGYDTSRIRRFPQEMIPSALKKLDMLNGASALIDLRSPPGNYLESLKGKLKGFYSIRINARWRLVFRWEGGDACDVSITDYH